MKQPLATTAEPGIPTPLHATPFDRGTMTGRALFLIAVAFALFQLYTAAYAPLSSLVTRAIHVGFVLLLVYGLGNTLPNRSIAMQLYNWLLGIVAFAVGLYQYVFESDLIQRAGDPSTADMIVGAISIVLVFEAARRLMGLALPLICLLFLLYALFGEYLPSPLDHRPYALSQVIDQLSMGTEGIYGIPILVSATYIFLFIVFGSFLERAGIIKLFSDLAIGSVGSARGGPAKVAVISSALMGTVNGSGVANVVTVGQFTIPMMKRAGFRPDFAGGVEATASMGGQIMPPVMGAVAFIMAETLGISYAEVVRAAVIPAVLYFASAFWMVHLEAGRLSLFGLSREQIPPVWPTLRRGWYLLIPLCVLIYMLFAGFTPLFAGMVGLACTAMLILGMPIAARLGPMPLRYAFWIALAGVGTLFFRYGVDVVSIIIALLLAVVAVLRGGRETLRIVIEALADGARNAIPVATACALVGVIIGVMTLTGAATNFARVVVEIGHNSLFLSLAMTMIACLILGMGIPTIPNYIITSSLVGPALLQLGVPLIISHMFVFYFGIMADLTPPVALAAFAAAPIAGASAMRIGFQAMRVAIVGFVIPYMAVYTPALMLQDGGPLAASIGYLPAVAYITVKAVASIGLWGAATIGFLVVPLAWWERVWAMAAAFLLVAAVPYTDEAGYALGIAFAARHLWANRRAAPQRSA